MYTSYPLLSHILHSDIHKIIASNLIKPPRHTVPQSSIHTVSPTLPPSHAKPIKFISVSLLLLLLLHLPTLPLPDILHQPIPAPGRASQRTPLRVQLGRLVQDGLARLLGRALDAAAVAAVVGAVLREGLAVRLVVSVAAASTGGR
ncbi:hypothetical protein PG984_014884 [Apiospora sp. TS-2023a]